MSDFVEFEVEELRWNLRRLKNLRRIERLKRDCYRVMEKLKT